MESDHGAGRGAADQHSRTRAEDRPAEALNPPKPPRPPEGSSSERPYSTAAARWLVALCAVAVIVLAAAGLRERRPPTTVEALLDEIRRGEPGFDRSLYGEPIRGARAVIWPEPGYVSPEQLAELQQLTEAGVVQVENYLKVSMEETYGANARIHYFVKGGAFISHTFGRYYQKENPKPVIFLSHVRERQAPYLHETVHVLTPEYGALWLREGLAEYLSNRFSRWPVFMRLEGNLIELNLKTTDGHARAHLTTAVGQEAWSLVGGNGVPTFANGDVRTLFYLLSGSFVAFLDRQLGTPTLMSLYRSPDVPVAFVQLTGRSVPDWKAAWLELR